MRLLIIGCGYIGAPLAAELARLGHEVFGLCRHPAETELRAAGVTPLVADITRREQLSTLPNGYDWVVHCVSSSGGTAEDYRAVYLRGTENVLEWLRARPPKRFVYTSSTSVYGQMDGSEVDEESVTEPAADTARVLVATEKLLLEAARRRGFPAIILRVAAIYGPGRGYWFRQFLRNEARIEGDGGRSFNMIHRDDVVGTIIAALEYGQPGEVYNAVDDEPVTQLEFYRWFAKQLGKELPPWVEEDKTLNCKRGVTNKRVSNRKLKTQLGYQFKYPTFREGYEEELNGLNDP
jgi:nucleoside-diphosphate-sugar epimerase